MNTCKCGNQKPVSDLQCRKCSKEAMAKLIKIAAVIGVILGLVCSSLPSNLQAPCKALSGILSTC